MDTLVDLGTLDGRLAGIERPHDARFSSGLCRALGERLGIDPLVVRVAAVVLTLAAGLGIALYFWGTVLTPRVGGQPPIRRLVPAFERWTTTSQVLAVVISTLVLVILVASTSRVPIGPAVIILVVVWLVRRRGMRPGQDPAAWPPPTTGAAPQAPTATVEEWRAHLRQQARSQHDVAAAPAPSPVAVTTPPAARAALPTSWLGATCVLLLGLVAAASSAVLGLGTNALLMALATGTAVVGASMLAWGLFVRSRRLPLALVAVALTGGALTAAAAIQEGTPYTETPVHQSETADGVMTYSYLADGKALVDLTHLSPDSTATVRVEAVASNVRILLPGEPAETIITSDLSDVTESSLSGPEGPVTTGITLQLDAALSKISVEYP